MMIERRGFLSGLGVFAVAGALSPAMRALAAAADDAALPLGDYWQPHLAVVSEKVRAIAAKTADGFWFITDPHVVSNRRQSGKALAALTPMTPLKKTICGGDLVEAFASKYETDKAGVDIAVDYYRLFWTDPIESSGQLVYTVKGNHDFTIKHDPKTPTGYTYPAEEAKRVIMGTKGPAAAVTNTADPTACYYYFDNAAAKIRYVCVDTTDSINPKAAFWAVRGGIGPTQLTWLADQAISTLPAGWGAVVVHHIPITGCVGTVGERKLYRDFRELLEAYQNRSTITLCGKTYDFTQAKGRILLDITGHRHAERQTFQKGILHVTEPCDAAYGDYIVGSKPWCGDLPRKKAGTVAEQTFDAVQLDPANDLVYFTRVGGGQDRVIHIKTRVAKAGATLKLTAPQLKGAITWGCYDADRVIYKPNPRNKYTSLISYANDCATIAADGTLTAKKAGEVMVVAMDANLNKEIFPVRIDAAETKSLKVLMIGNSFSICVLREMPAVAKAMDLKLDLCSLYIGGCSLETHWKNVCRPEATPYAVGWNYGGVVNAKDAPVAKFAKGGNIPAVLAADKWDVVTLQQASHFSWRPETYHPFGDDLVKTIRKLAPQAKIVVQETWSYTPWDKRFAKWGIDQNEMYAKLHDAYAAFAKPYGFGVIPVGTAVQKWRTALPVKYTENSIGGDVVGSPRFEQKDGTWIPKGDVFHFNGDGNYLQALVWTAKLFDADVTKCPYAPKRLQGSRADLMKKVAMDAVLGR